MPGTLVDMPGALPDGEPVPVDGVAARHRPARGRRARLRRVRARAVLRQPLRLLRLQHVHGRPSWAAGRAARRYADTVLAELALAAPGARRRPPPGSTRSSSAAARRPCSPPTTWPGSSTASTGTWGLAPGRRGDHRGQPGVGRPGSRCRRCGAPASPGSRWACSRPRRTCWRSWTAGTRRAGPPPAATRGPRGRVRARQPGPDLRHAGGDAPRTSPPRCAAVVAAGVDHVSAYALIVEDGTRLAARMRRGELPYPDDDVAADRYLAAEAALDAAGLLLVRGVQLGPRRGGPVPAQPALLDAAATGGASGPGAHSHVGGVRWWNVKHPSRVRDSGWPAARRRARPGRCSPPTSAHVEDVMLRLRLAEGLPLAALDDAGRAGAGAGPRRRAAGPPTSTRPAGRC